MNDASPFCCGLANVQSPPSLIGKASAQSEALAVVVVVPSGAVVTSESLARYTASGSVATSAAVFIDRGQPPSVSSAYAQSADVATGVSATAQSATVAAIAEKSSLNFSSSCRLPRLSP